MNKGNPPWGQDDYWLDWDDDNRGELWRHQVSDSEIEQCFENGYYFIPHPRSHLLPQKYGDRYYVFGVTDGGRQLLIVVQWVCANQVRPITAWDKRWKGGE